MSIWIRSQDRRRIAKVNGIKAFDKKIFIRLLDGTDFIVGQYKTEEETFKVMNNLQSFMEKQHFYNGAEFDSIEHRRRQLIYQMPKKGEVE